VIRPAEPKDAPWIAAIWNEVIADSLITFTTTLKSDAEIAQMIAARPVLVLENAGGFATYGPFRSGPGYNATAEHTVLLAPHARGQGLGRRLLGALIDVARADGKHVLVAGISSANPAAVAFHSALGFQQTAQMPQVGRKAGHWLDLILMQKMLNPPDTAPNAG
jgi:phosphinothricin acetyltransferase